MIFQRFIVLLLVLAACTAGEETSPPMPGAGPAEAPVRYDRRLLFLAGVPGAFSVGIFDFEMVQDSERLSYSSRGWLGRQDQWTQVLDTVWHIEPVREPWRLLPHGSLRLLVDNGGNLEALIHGRGEEEVRLVPGRLLATYPTSGVAELVLQAAELRSQGRPLIGSLLDTRIGGWHGLPPRAAADTVRLRQLFLTDGGELFAVLAETSPNLAHLWLRRGEDEGALDWVNFSRTSSETDRPPARESWTLEASGGLVHAELLARGSIGLPDGSSYYPVEGWLLAGEARRQVFGLVLDRSR